MYSFLVIIKIKLNLLTDFFKILPQAYLLPVRIIRHETDKRVIVTVYIRISPYTFLLKS